MPWFWMSLQVKHKPLTVVDSMRTCLRRGMHSEPWLTRRGPTCTHLFVIQPQPLTDGCLLYIIINFHPFCSGGAGDANATGRIPLETEKGAMSLCFSLYFSSCRPPLSFHCVSCEWSGKVGVEEEGGWVVRKRDRKGLKASLWMTKT